MCQTAVEITTAVLDQDIAHSIVVEAAEAGDSPLRVTNGARRVPHALFQGRAAHVPSCEKPVGMPEHNVIFAVAVDGIRRQPCRHARSSGPWSREISRWKTIW